MKCSKILALGLAGILSLAFAMGCNKSNPVSGKSSQPFARSSVVVMKAAAKQSVSGTLASIPVKGGLLNIQSALINIEKFQIEENSGVDVEQQGDHNDGSADGPEGPDNEKDFPDIIATGPYSVDIVNAETFLDSVAVYPGTFKKVDLTFILNSAEPYNGSTILIKGEFQADNGSSTPFTVRSSFTKEIQSRIAGNGITVANNTTVPIIVSFDLQGWFKTIDFAAAQKANGEILIDKANNPALLSAFENNLSQNVEVEEKH